MPLFGAHMSIAGGYYKALLAAEAHGCNTVQLFTNLSIMGAMLFLVANGSGPMSVDSLLSNQVKAHTEEPTALAQAG